MQAAAAVIEYAGFGFQTACVDSAAVADVASDVQILCGDAVLVVECGGNAQAVGRYFPAVGKAAGGNAGRCRSQTAAVADAAGLNVGFGGVKAAAVVEVAALLQKAAEADMALIGKSAGNAEVALAVGDDAAAVFKAV